MINIFEQYYNAIFLIALCVLIFITTLYVSSIIIDYFKKHELEKLLNDKRIENINKYNKIKRRL